MTKKDTMCEQCTPAKRIVGANPEGNQQINWMENNWKIAPEGKTSSILQPTKAVQLYWWSCNIVAHNRCFSSGMPYSTNMPPGNTARGVKRGEMMMFSKHWRDSNWKLYQTCWITFTMNWLKGVGRFVMFHAAWHVLWLCLYLWLERLKIRSCCTQFQSPIGMVYLHLFVSRLCSKIK